MSAARTRWSNLFWLLLAGACGALVVARPVAGTLVSVATLALVLAAGYVAALPRVFLVCAGILLLGYALLGKGFAYLGFPPLYVGELTLAVGIVAAAAVPGGDLWISGAFPKLLLAFMLVGLARTLPFLGVFGIDALRDAVIWGYGLFALLVAACLLQSGWLARVPEQYGRLAGVFLVWVPVSWAAYSFAGESLPTVPGRSLPLISYKPGDSAVQLAGVASFALVGLAPWSTRSPAMASRLREVAFWAAWLVAFLVVASFNRGGLLSIVVALAVVLLLGGRSVARRARSAGAIAIALGISFLALDAAGAVSAIRPPGEARALSVSQLTSNLTSIVGSGHDRQELEGSREWRLTWWSEIVRYTVRGPYFWTGKGFGVNLASDDGFQVDADGSLRSPHNGHLAILARAGVPGLALWAALQLTFSISLLRALLRARRDGDQRTAQLALWVLAYWVAAMVNTTFDVYLESPQGGIWTWSLIGVGLAVIEEQRRRGVSSGTMW